ncbi:MAG TPA: ABC transporter ATP-binding protein [Acidobacteriaceae bacterium]|nr:ABC transporter ATP-binding protein [Acidobacteriaceae bacterium]
MQQPSPSTVPIGGSQAAPLAALKSRPDAEPLLRIENLSKTYPGSASRAPLTLFHHLNLTIKKGELVAIVGQSGSGKSTLLHMMGALDAPSSGTIYCGPTQITQLSLRDAARFRNRQVGYVWQFHYLLPEFTAQENVAMPLLAQGLPRKAALQQAADWLAETGLADRAQHRPGELSGGEQQRVALARALITKPALLLADEPTGDLDGDSADLVFGLIERLHTAHGLTSVLVTHNLELAGRCTRTLRLTGGALVESSPSESFVTPSESK